MKVADPVIKYLTVRLDEEFKRQEKLKRHRERRAARRPRKTAACSGSGMPVERRTERPQQFQLREKSNGRTRAAPQHQHRTERRALRHSVRACGPAGRPGPRRRRGRPGGPAKRGKRSFVRKKKVCRFCVDKADFIDYKKADILGAFIQERGKILPRRMTGTCARHQRWLTVAIKRAQNIALLPFAAEL